MNIIPNKVGVAKSFLNIVIALVLSIFISFPAAASNDTLPKSDFEIFANFVNDIVDLGKDGTKLSGELYAAYLRLSKKKEVNEIVEKIKQVDATYDSIISRLKTMEENGVSRKKMRKTYNRLAFLENRKAKLMAGFFKLKFSAGVLESMRDRFVKAKIDVKKLSKHLTLDNAGKGLMFVQGGIVSYKIYDDLTDTERTGGNITHSTEAEFKGFVTSTSAGMAFPILAVPDVINILLPEKHELPSFGNYVDFSVQMHEDYYMAVLAHYENYVSIASQYASMTHAHDIYNISDWEIEKFIGVVSDLQSETLKSLREFRDKTGFMGTFTFVGYNDIKEELDDLIADIDEDVADALRNLFYQARADAQLKKQQEVTFWNDVFDEYGLAYASEELGAWIEQYHQDIIDQKRLFDEQTARVEIARMVDKWKADVAKKRDNRMKTGAWEGGMIGVSRDKTAWWQKRAQDSVTATPSKNGILIFRLNHPDTQQPARFKVDPTDTNRIVGRDLYVYAGEIEFLDFPADDTLFRSFYTNGAQDFFRFEWVLRNNEGVFGYYGERIHAQSPLPKSGVSTYQLVHNAVTKVGSRPFLGGYADMKLFVDWKTDTVYGVATNSTVASWGILGKDVSGTDNGPILYVGKLDRDKFSITGRYVSKPNFAQRRYAQGFTPKNTSLQIYGTDYYPNGIGGTFATRLYDEKGYVGQEATQMSGFRNFDSFARKPDVQEHWYGFASGLFVNRSTGKVDMAYNTNSNYVYMGFQPDEGTMRASIYVSKDGASDLDYKFSSTWENSVYINKDAFAALEDVDGVPSYVATAMDGDTPYHYLSWGVWNAEQVSAPDTAMANGSYWVAGTLTPETRMPRTGSATYVGQVHGSVYETDRKIGGARLPPAIQSLTGTSELTANFGTRKVSGHLTMNYVHDGGHYAKVDLQDNVLMTGNHFKGDLGGSNITSGKIHGAFYGRDASYDRNPAKEIGGNWHIKKEGSQAVGVFYGKEVSAKK